MKISWHIKHFNELSIRELHDLIQLRLSVFVVEQNCVYQDLDGKDMDAYHIIGKLKNGELIATARILPVDDKKVVVGRVVVKESVRKYGLGRELMKETINKIVSNFGELVINISAQKYLLNFYLSLGFTATENEYLEDGIPHIEMNLNLIK